VKKALVTGGAGFIGSNLVDRLINMNFEVLVVDNESSDSHESFYWNEKASNYKLDIREYSKIRPLFDGVDFVFHLAAESRIQSAIDNPVDAVSTNVLGTCNILQAAREANVERVIYSSTSSAYGLKNTPPMLEDMPSDCLNPYSVSKVCGEELCKVYTNLFGLKTIIFRYFNVYGERQPTKGKYATVVGLFLKQRRDGQPMTIVGDGLQTRDFTYVGDIVDANIKAICATSGFGEKYNIGCGSEYSILELAEMIGGDYVFTESRIGETRNTRADITKAEKKLNWKPKTKLKDWIDRTKT